MIAARFSLNAPVIATPELPAGPARAAILLYLEGGQRQVLVAIRSLSRGVAVQYQLFSKDLQEITGVALDAALSFAESMGFLFDDECVHGKSPEERHAALAMIRDLFAPILAGEESAVAKPPEVEILLQEDHLVGQEAAPVTADRGGNDPAPGSQLGFGLTKFRSALPVASSAFSEAEQEREQARSVGAAGVPGAVSPLLRLLAAF